MFDADLLMPLWFCGGGYMTRKQLDLTAYQVRQAEWLGLIECLGKQPHIDAEGRRLSGRPSKIYSLTPRGVQCLTEGSHT